MAGTKPLDIVKTVFQRRLQQADMDRILAELSVADRTELVAKMGTLLDRISALVEVYNKVSDTLSLDVMLPRLMSIITEALRADRSTLFLNDTDTNELYSRVAQGDKIGEIRFPNHLGIAGSVFVKGEAVLIPDAYADARFNQAVDKKTGYRTRNILCVPLKNKDRIIGVTQVLNKIQGAFDEDDMALLEALTAKAASALENAQLYEKVEKARQEETKLLEVTTAISSELRLDTLLGKIIHVTTEMLEADRSTLFIHDAKKNELWSRVAEGMSSREIRIPAGAGIAGLCFTSGEVVNVPDAYADVRFNQAVDKKTGYRTNTILCMPIVNKAGRKLGVIQVLNKKKGPFGLLDERRLKAFTAQAAIALENAQLFADVTNERNYNESILKSLSNGVVTLDEERKVLKVNDAALKIMRWKREDVLEKSAGDLFHAPGNRWVLNSLEKVAASGVVDVSMDAELTLAGESRASVNLSSVPLSDLESKPIGGMLIVEDITTEKRVKSTMARYMTKEVADRLLAGGQDALGGSAQVASVLFSDIRSFTTISETLGAKQTVHMLNDYFTEMIEVIFGHKGILDKYIGDAIMAVFGAPFQSPEDADNAVKAANDMIKSLRAHNAARAAKGEPEIKIGVGISTGELISGNIGSLKRMDYTVIGDTVNLASRLESATKYYGVQVLFSEFTIEKLVGTHHTRELDLIRVKGKNKPVAVFEGLDHHCPESFPRMKETLAAYQKGLLLYRGRRFQEGLAAFSEALAANPEDGPSTLYLKRCKEFLKTPPDDAWDGVWVMKDK